uniref:Uncharacterized protein n=1 Tax=Oncorhynchus tshawytscha TaxID=74940 RepID=A0A8C8C5Z7_ONCTS
MAAEACSVLITGANRGLGLEMVKQMVESPWPVRQLLACCRDLDGLRAEVRAELLLLELFLLCVCQTPQTPAALRSQPGGQSGGKGWAQRASKQHRGADHRTMQTTSTQEILVAFNTNILGPMDITKEFLLYLQSAATASGKPGMSCSKPAVVSISNMVASMATIKEMCSFFPMASAGLNMLTLCTTEEFRMDEILFAVLYPGWVRTDMGGEGGVIDAPESVEGLLSVMDSLGKVMPW